MGDPTPEPPTYTITGIDRATGEKVSYPLTAQEVERIMIAGDGLPSLEPDDDDEGDAAA